MPRSSAGSETSHSGFEGQRRIETLGPEAEATSLPYSEPALGTTVSAVNVRVGNMRAKRRRPGSADRGRNDQQDAEEPPSQRIKTEVEDPTANWEGDTIANTVSPTEMNTEPLTDGEHDDEDAGDTGSKAQTLKCEPTKGMHISADGTKLEAGIIGSCSRRSCGRN